MNLQLGLNLKPNSKTVKHSFQLGKKRVANPLEEEEGDEDVVGIKKVSMEIKNQQEKQSALVKDLHSKALQEDENVFDYDAVYDDLKNQEKARRAAQQGIDANGVKRARYMEDLITASRKRKLYMEQAKEKRLEKERQIELEMYGEKEQFVTESYRQKQQELQKLLEQEKIQDSTINIHVEAEADPNRPRNEARFFKGLLDQMDRIKGPFEMKTTNSSSSLYTEQDKNEQEMVQKNISQTNVNENNEIIDKRQLLSGGLNITSKAIRRKEMDDQNRREMEKQVQKERKDIEKRTRQERNRLVIQQQMIQVENEKIKVKEKEREMIVKQLLVSKVSEDTVMDAKARYLARKRQQDKQ